MQPERTRSDQEWNGYTNIKNKLALLTPIMSAASSSTALSDLELRAPVSTQEHGAGSGEMGAAC